MKSYKAAVGLRGDCLYCPLPLSVDSYWNCLTDCHHCCFRRLNRTWGMDLRPADPESVGRKLENGLNNKNPRSSLAWALSLKKTIRIGSRTDPFQDAERTHRITHQILPILRHLQWSYVIQTRHLRNVLAEESELAKAHKLGLLTALPIISPGAEWDWEYLERKRTTPIEKRLRIIRRWVGKGWSVGVNGEPFIPGVHSIDQFRDILRRLKSVGVRNYNTYNLHFNDHVARRLHSIGIDIEKVWEMNQDDRWRPIQLKLCEVSEEEGVVLGCPDFVNTGLSNKQCTNTCCGINVPNPSRYNAHTWKIKLQHGERPEDVEENTWEGIGDRDQGRDVLFGNKSKFYTMKDAGLL